jgi:hypothetical protein
LKDNAIIFCPSSVSSHFLNSPVFYWLRKGVKSSYFNILMNWTHGGLRLRKGPVPVGRRASSVDFYTIPEECRPPPALSSHTFTHQCASVNARTKPALSLM